MLHFLLPDISVITGYQSHPRHLQPRAANLGIQEIAFNFSFRQNKKSIEIGEILDILKT
jgi:hypothetical protein